MSTKIYPRLTMAQERAVRVAVWKTRTPPEEVMRQFGLSRRGLACILGGPVKIGLGVEGKQPCGK